MEVVLLDGYVDEPAHHGAPPYISTYPRYVAGAIVDAGVKEKNISYFTIDQYRKDAQARDKVHDADFVVLTCGMAVPVKSIGGTFITWQEMKTISENCNGKTLVGGPVRFGVIEEGGMTPKKIPDTFDFISYADVEHAAHELVKSNFSIFDDKQVTLDELESWAQKGAFIVKQHPNYPNYIITEVKIARGCPYNCSFCIEPLYGTPTSRKATDVVKEIKALYDNGIRNFRLQAPNFLLFGRYGNKPDPQEMKTLYKGIRRVAPDLEVLHLDNINPKTIALHPKEAEECLKIIVKHNTPGDVAAMGLESADPVVQKQNHLTINNKECMTAIRLINKIGNKREGRSLPKLLPGINFVYGLKGQTKKTFKDNLDFLQKVMDEGLLLRRINLRQVSTHPGTEMHEFGIDLVKKHKATFQKYKRKIREEIDHEMLKKIAPQGTVIRNCTVEAHEGQRSFARPLGSYPLLIGLMEYYPLGTKMDIAVTDYGYRSITGVKYPLDPNTATARELQSIPGVGKKRAMAIIKNRPYATSEELNKVLDIDISNYVS